MTLILFKSIHRTGEKEMATSLSLPFGFKKTLYFIDNNFGHEKYF